MHLTKNHCHILKTRENSFQWSATILKQWKKYFWKIDFWKFEIFKIFLASKWWHFIDGYFHEFLRYDNDSWCKRKLNIHILRCKSFLLPSLVFYPSFLRRKLTENRIWTFKTSHIQTKKGGQKTSKGGKKLLHLLEEHLSFLLHQESLPYLKNSWI